MIYFEVIKMLKFKDIYDIKNNKEIKKLYEEAFPKEEKLPFNFWLC